MKTRREQVRWFASALVHRGRDPASLRSLSELVKIDLIKEGLRFLLQRRGGKPTRHLQNMLYALRSLAQWTGAHPDDLAEITRLCGRLNPGVTGLTQKNRAAVRQFDDPRNVDALLSLPRTLLARARRRRGRPSLYAALDVQVAVAIELLLVAPVRIGNLVSVRFGRNLLQVRRNGPQHLVFPSADVKNEADLEFPLPAETTELLELYCREFRPQLSAAPGDWLFPGENGSHKRPATLAFQIRKRIRALTGLTVTPHQFRHVGAKLFLDANPGGYEVVRRVLGHRKSDTTTAFYTGLESAAAVRHFDAEILRLRSLAGPAEHPAAKRGSASTRASR
jgi:integrase